VKTVAPSNRAPPATSDKAALASNDEGSQARSTDDVPAWLHWLGGIVDRHPRFWLRMARLESSGLREQLREVSLRAPIYVCGLARSGSTLLHEVVSSHPAVSTHRLKDYPLVFTPYWWRRASAGVRAKPPRERPHRDGMMITAESPDSIEEMLWMAFFPRCHDPAVSSVLSAGERHPAFEEFYGTHIRKLLLAERATRYATKANYHVARIAYLLRLFPDAKFIIPVRAPLGHIASLARQQTWFSQVHSKYPRTLAFMQRSGHFEFGLDRRPINLGDDRRIAHIVEVWKAGQEVRGLAMYWDMVYAHLARLFDSDEQVRNAAFIVRFETLCDDPAGTLRSVFEHCELPDAAPVVASRAAAIRQPTYYEHRFSDQELDAIRAETAATARWWGYME
jgi:hypothetical protein